AGFLAPAVGTSLYLALATSISLSGSEYGSCTDSYQCSDHGAAVQGVQLSAEDQASCSCICNVSMPYVGSNCNEVSGTSTVSVTGVIQLLFTIPLASATADDNTTTSTPLPSVISSSALQAAVTAALSATDAITKSVQSCSLLGVSNFSSSVDGAAALLPAALFTCNVVIANTTITSRRTILDAFSQNVQSAITAYRSFIFVDADNTSTIPENTTTVALMADALHTSSFGNCSLTTPASSAVSFGVTCTNQVARMISPFEQALSLRVVVTSDVNIESITIQSTYDNNGSLTTQTFACHVVRDGSAVGGCIQSTCLLGHAEAQAMVENSTSIFITAVPSTLDGNNMTSSVPMTSPFTQQWCALQADNAFQVQVLHAAVLPTSSQVHGENAHLITQNPNFKLALVGVGIAVIAVAFILLIFGVVFMYKDNKIRNQLHEEASVEPTKVTRLLHENFAKMKYYVRTPDRFRFEHWGVALAVIGYNIAIAGGVLLLVAYFYPNNATYRVSIESYADDRCALSALSDTPNSLLMVDPTEGCTSDGGSVGQGGFGRMGVTATCSFINGTWWAYVTYGATLGDCHSFSRDWELTDNSTEFADSQVIQTVVQSGEMWVRNGSCIASPSFFLDPFISVYCGDKESAGARYDAVRSSLGSRVPPLLANSTVIRDAPTLPLTAIATADVIAAAELIGAVATPYVSGTTIFVSSSYTDEFLSSVAAPETGEQTEEQLPSLSRLVYQTSSSFVADPTSTAIDASLAVALGTASLSISSPELTSENLSTYLPLPNTLSLNAPIGFNFHTADGDDASAPSPVEALYGDQRYYRMAESTYDIGYYYGPETSSDGYGFTVSFYGRFDAAAEGFVFIATDAVEEHDPTTGNLRSPIVDAAAVMESQLLSGEDWFETPFRVYYALYVSASTNRMHFIMADPVRSKTSIVDVSGNSSRYARGIFGLENYGAGGGNLFNGEWHHVALVLKNENSDVMARLMVDGFYDIKDTQCLPRRPTPVADTWTVGTTVSSLRPLSATAFTGGALYVGAFKGAVSGLRFEPTAVPVLTLITRGTAASRSLHNLNRDEIYTIACVLIFLSVLLALLTACSSGYAVSVDSNKNDDSDEATSVAMFVKVTRHEVEEDAPSGNRKFVQRYPRPSFTMSKRWLGLTRTQLTLKHANIPTTNYCAQCT
ncbi:membrane-associated protein, putative, partial [Bodo saltans]